MNLKTNPFSLLFKPLAISIVLFCIVMLSPVQLSAHGIDISVGMKYPCVFIKAEYDGGSAIANADVSIIYQGNATSTADEPKEDLKKEYQKSNADKNGAFAFCPDQTGKWTIIVDDQMGHRASEDIIIDESFFNPNQDQVAASGTNEKSAPVKQPLSKNDLCCYLLKLVLGLVLIGAVTLIVKRLSKKNEA